MAAPNVLTQALLVARLDLRRRLRDRSVLIQVILAPVLLALIIGGAFSGDSGGLRADIWLADADGSELSTQIVAALAGQSEPGGEGVSFVAKPGLDAAAAEAAVDADEADAVVVIPAGFGAAVRAGEAAELRVLGDAGDDVVAGIARSVADGIANGVQTQRAAIATTLTAAAQLGEEVSADDVARVATATPAAITVRDSRFENTFSMMSFFAPGMAMIFLFFVMGAAARSLVTERREGTLPRMLAGPTSPTAVLLGKALAVLTLGFTSLLMVWGITSLGFGVDWGDPLGVLLVITGAVVAIAGISLVITGLARTESQSEALTIVFALVLSVLGGSFVYTATGFLAEVRKFTPNGQALMAFSDLAAGNASPADVLPAVLLLLGGGLVTGAIGLLAIRRGLAP
ncbi:MAG TPA: ABC transporter permease [Demequina sp.]|nr:ABC transporter permease [Demequina sp.]